MGVRRAWSDARPIDLTTRPCSSSSRSGFEPKARKSAEASGQYHRHPAPPPPPPRARELFSGQSRFRAPGNEGKALTLYDQGLVHHLSFQLVDHLNRFGATGPGVFNKQFQSGEIQQLQASAIDACPLTVQLHAKPSRFPARASPPPLELFPRAYIPLSRPRAADTRL